MSRLAKVQDAATVAAFRLGWAGLRALPEPAAYGLFDRIADLTFKRNGPSVQMMRHNYALVRPELSPAELDALTKAGVRSYLRYWCDAFRLPTLSEADIVDRVTTSGDEAEVRRRVEAGESIVLFLGHMGNWDLAGAWSATQLAHVTTVAERLKPEELFQRFLSFRESLGMTIIPLTKGVDVMADVSTALRKPGGFAPLLADRDLTAHGALVDLCGHEAKVAIGPAALALRTRATLVPISITYNEPDGRAMRSINVHFHNAVSVATQDGETARQAVLRATQECATAIGSTIKRKTEDWHMMQRVFLDDVNESRGRN